MSEDTSGAMKYSSQHRRDGGFTLIEIAVVIAIIGLLTAGVAALLTTLLKTTKSKVAGDNAAIVQQSFQRFIERNGRLPCPAVPTLGPGVNGYGVEDTVVAAPAQSCPNVAVVGINMARGVVPWVTLGLPLEQVQDGYNNLFTYHVTTSATQTNSANVSAVMGNMTLHTGTPTNPGLQPVGNQINSCMNPAPPPPLGDDGNGCNLRAVVVLLSHGQNGAGAFTPQGVASPPPVSAAELENLNADVKFVKGEVNATGYDDLVFAWTMSDLIEPLTKQGSLKSAEAITNDSLRNVAIVISNRIVNSASAYVVGPPIVKSIATIPSIPPQPPGLGTDAWGRPIVYATANLGVDLCTLPDITVAFTLRSDGLDGVDSTTGGAPNPATGRNDDLSVPVTVGGIRSQINNRPGYGC